MRHRRFDRQWPIMADEDENGNIEYCTYAVVLSLQEETEKERESARRGEEGGGRGGGGGGGSRSFIPFTIRMSICSSMMEKAKKS